MPIGLRKLALTAHISTSVGWMGAAAAYLILVVVSLRHPDGEAMRGVWRSLEILGWFALVPLAAGSLLTGLVVSLGTSWGLFRHYWVLAKLLITLTATTVLVLHMPTVSLLAARAAATASPPAGGLWGEVLHAGGGLVLLLLTMVLSVYKPAGTTPFGRQKGEAAAGLPRWVKVSGVLILLLGLVVLLALLAGGHGPGRHA